MARRRNKQKFNLLESLFIMTLVITFFWVLNETKSMKLSVNSVCLVFAGFLVILIYRHRLRKAKLKKSVIAEIDKMNGRQFEHYLGHLFKGHGYTVKVTQAAGDFGADLVISKAGKKIVIQAKRYSRDVGIKAVQEAQASIAHYGASEAWVVSNSEYTTAAYTLAKSNNVKLVTRNELIKLILKMNPGSVPIDNAKEIIKNAPFAVIQKQQTSNPVMEAVNCSKCGANMHRRSGPRGPFLGCGNYPKCKNTISLNI